MQVVTSAVDHLTNTLHSSNVETFIVACLNANIKLTKLLVNSRSGTDLLAYFMLKQEMIVEQFGRSLKFSLLHCLYVSRILAIIQNEYQAVDEGCVGLLLNHTYRLV